MLHLVQHSARLALLLLLLPLLILLLLLRDYCSTAIATTAVLLLPPLLLLQFKVDSLSAYLQQSTALAHPASLCHVVVQAYWRGTALWLS